MAEFFVWRNPVADPLFEFLDFGKATFCLTRPNRLTVDPDLEKAAGPIGNERYPTQLLFEGGEQFLSHPSGAQEPPALGAVLDLDGR